MPAETAGRTEGLAALQRWLQGAIVAPVETGAEPEPAEAAARVRPSRTLEPAERVGIYANMYLQRMRECLESDYPALRALAGEAAFDSLVRAYLARFPSRHWSLNPLGARLPELLEDPKLRVPRKALLRDVARLEAAMARVFDAPRSERLAPEALAALPPERWPALRLVPIPALELHAFAHRANRIVTALRDGRAPGDLGRKRTHLVVWRREGTVWRMELDRAQHALLAALVAGRPLGEALAAGAAAFRGGPGLFLERVRAWFADWSAEGFFARCEPS